MMVATRGAGTAYTSRTHLSFSPLFLFGPGIVCSALIIIMVFSNFSCQVLHCDIFVLYT
jgi:hypothetical protein